MASNLFLPFAAGPSANVVTDAQWAALIASSGADNAGFVQGLAISAQANKAWRQATLMSAVLGQIIADLAAVDATDSQTVAVLEQHLLGALTRRTQTLQYLSPGAIPPLTIPAGLYMIEVEIGGAGNTGGVGSLGSDGPGSGGGGGAGEVRRLRVPVAPGNTVTGTVGSSSQASTLSLNGSVVVSASAGAPGGNANGITPGAGGAGGYAGAFAPGYTGEAWSGGGGSFGEFISSTYGRSAGGAAFGGAGSVTTGGKQVPGLQGGVSSGGSGGIGLLANGSAGQPGGLGGAGYIVIRGLI